MTAAFAFGEEPEHKTRKVQENRMESESPGQGTGKRLPSSLGSRVHEGVGEGWGPSLPTSPSGLLAPPF